MKYALFIGIFLLFACNDSVELEGSQEIPEFPSFEKIIDEFYDNYSQDGLKVGEVYGFQKKPTGWHVCVNDYSSEGQGKETDNQLFWSAESEKYLDLTFGSKSQIMDVEKLKSQNLNSWQARNYQIYPYFGYQGWEMDVIDLLENKDQLSDSLMNALARAYSIHATNFLNNNSGYALESEMFQLKNEGSNSMNSEQLEKYRKYVKLADDTYKKLEEQNRDFPTFIGSVNTKRSNQTMASFLDLRIYQNEQEAQSQIKDELYSDAIISFAKNYLSTCPQNAILITAGDIDTYPLLYCQSKLKFRQDVRIINTSLLNVPRYVAHHRNPLENCDKVDFGIPQEAIQDDNRAYLFVDHMNTNEVELKDVIDSIAQQPTAEANISSKPSMLPANYKITSDNGVFRFSIKRQVIYRNDLMLLGLIANNDTNRPICFTNGHNPNNLLGLTEFLKSEGLVHVLSFSDPQVLQGGELNAEAFSDNLMNQYDFESLSSVLVEDERIINNYSALFHQLAEYYIRNNEQEKAKAVLDRWNEVIGVNTKRYFIPAYLSIVGDYDLLNENEKANEIRDIIKSKLSTLYDYNSRQQMTEEQAAKITEWLDE